ncbi:MAG: alanine dehydrogenase [Peptococcaceae bacterium]|nr:alanine dehydrogenase [Candidatus Syntrophopropionicum ammoniitolerans]
MIVGIPKEHKIHEDRVAITPAGVQALIGAGHRVLIETGAGLGSGISDETFRAAGAEIQTGYPQVYEESELILKVKEPLPQEYPLLREGQVLFTYLHLAREPELTNVLVKKKVIAIAYETVQLDSGILPLLMPMSEIAGRMAVQIGAHFLEKPCGGRGILLGGVPGVPAADVVIIGAGTVGANAARIAVGMGAQVTIIDRSTERLAGLDDIYGNKIKTLISNQCNIERSVSYADLLIGAVLIAGAKTPKLVSEDFVKQMKTGAVIIDVAVDQGGSIETIDRLTTHSDPVYEKYGVIHYAVANMPGAVARTSSFTLTNATLPYVLELANKGFFQAVLDNRALARGVNIYKGSITCRAVGESLNLEYCELGRVLARQAG